MSQLLDTEPVVIEAPSPTIPCHILPENRAGCCGRPDVHAAEVELMWSVCGHSFDYCRRAADWFDPPNLRGRHDYQCTTCGRISAHLIINPL